MIAPGFVCRGQGVRKDDRFGTIHRRAASVDGEVFVIVRFREGEELVSVFELSLAGKACLKENFNEKEERVFGELEDGVTPELECKPHIQDRDGELLEIDENEKDNEFVEEEMEYEAY